MAVEKLMAIVGGLGLISGAAALTQNSNLTYRTAAQPAAITPVAYTQPDVTPYREITDESQKQTSAVKSTMSTIVVPEEQTTSDDLSGVLGGQRTIYMVPPNTSVLDQVPATYNPEDLTQEDAVNLARHLFNKVTPAEILMHSGSIDLDKANQGRAVYDMHLPEAMTSRVQTPMCIATTPEGLGQYLTSVFSPLQNNKLLTADELQAVQQNGSAFERLYLSQFGPAEGAYDANGNLTDSAMIELVTARTIEDRLGMQLDTYAAMVERLLRGEMQINADHTYVHNPDAVHLKEWEMHPDDAKVYEDNPRYIVTGGEITFVATPRSALGLNEANNNYISATKRRRGNKE